MIAVLTGDIIQSTERNKDHWLPALKAVLASQGAPAADWEIYRGDEFQLRLKQPENAVTAAFRIKAHLKAVADTDIRIAIGFGPPEGSPKNGTSITESNGPAFVHSGRKLDEIKKDRVNLAIASAHPEFDREINLMLQWVLLTADNWTTVSAEIVDFFLENPQLSQNDMAQRLKIQQSAISQRLKRASFDLLWESLLYFKDKIQHL